MQLRVELHDFKPAPDEHRAAEHFESTQWFKGTQWFKREFLGVDQPIQYDYLERTYG
ncbi:hypothetical protein [Trinickia symbiotica]|uniref:hypothetical protein n=1 Tax=Trinickia symbiotica TaxID=863227 RepID=UPI00037D48E0|nr:hypothetical protein [Trinickia symbiotica]